MTRPWTALGIALFVAGAGVTSAVAEEIVKTGDAGAPVAAVAPGMAVLGQPTGNAGAVGAWADNILNGGPATPDADAPKPPSACEAVVGDGKTHGEVSAGIGTRGYREVGGVVSQPVGRCGRVTVMVNQVDGETPSWRARR